MEETCNQSKEDVAKMRTKEEIFGADDPQEVLMSCSPMIGEEGFKNWCERVHGLQIKPFHLEWIRALETQKRVGIFAPTGFGKSTVFVIAYPLWKMWYNNYKQFLIVSTSMPQSTTLLQRVKQEIMDNELLKELVPDIKYQIWNKTELNTSTKCKMFCKPYGENIKSYHVDYVLCDEAASYKDWSVFFKYVITRATAKKGTVACISTPEGEGDMMAAKLRGNQEWWFRTYSCYDETGESIWPERFSKEWLHAREMELGMAAFSLQYKCDTKVCLDDPDVQPFPFRLVVANSDPKEKFEKEAIPGEIYYAAYDPAFSITGDYHAIIVARKTDDKIRIARIYRFKSSPEEAEAVLKAMNFKFRPVKLVIDTSSGGVMVMQSLMKLNLPCVAFPFIHESRNAGFRATIQEFHKGTIIIPTSDECSDTKAMTDVLYSELTHIIREKTPRGLPTYVSKTKNDDVAMAFLMLIKTLVDEAPFLPYFRTGTHKEAIKKPNSIKSGDPTTYFNIET